MSEYLISTGVLPKAVGKDYWEYRALPRAYRELNVDGMELVFLPEWEAEQPPVTPFAADWRKTPKISPIQLANFISTVEIPVPVVHINRDVGKMLCGAKDTILRGQKILDENLAGAVELAARVTVLHMWDTHAPSLDLERLWHRVYEVSSNYRIPLSIENIPLSDERITTTGAWQFLQGIMPGDYGFTLDLSWSSLYDDLADLKEFLPRVFNVHVQGYISKVVQADNLLPRVGSLDILASLAQIRKAGYDGYITLELNNPGGLEDFLVGLELIKANS